MIIFTLYQWTLDDSWLSILLSVFTFLGLLGGLAYPTWRVISRHRNLDVATDYHFFLKFAPLHGIYRAPRFYFFVPLIISTFLKSIFIAAGKNNGLAQVVLFMIVELFNVVLHFALRPYVNKKGDVLNTFLAIVRFVCVGLMIAFLQQLRLGAILRTVIGCVIGVIYSAAVIVLFFNIVVNAVQDVKRAIRTKGRTSEEAYGASSDEKIRRNSEVVGSPTSEMFQTSRT